MTNREIAEKIADEYYDGDLVVANRANIVASIEAALTAQSPPDGCVVDENGNVRKIVYQDDNGTGRIKGWDYTLDVPAHGRLLVLGAPLPKGPANG